MNKFFAKKSEWTAMKVSVVSKSCQIVRIHQFEPPSRSKFIIFQKEYKGPETKNLITGAPKSLVPLFHTTCVIYSNANKILRDSCLYQ